MNREPNETGENVDTGWNSNGSDALSADAMIRIEVDVGAGRQSNFGTGR
ncbi:hypothetical protein [Halomontanus rarus]